MAMCFISREALREAHLDACEGHRERVFEAPQKPACEGHREGHREAVLDAPGHRPAQIEGQLDVPSRRQGQRLADVFPQRQGRREVQGEVQMGAVLEDAPQVQQQQIRRQRLRGAVSEEVIPRRQRQSEVLACSSVRSQPESLGSDLSSRSSTGTFSPTLSPSSSTRSPPHRALPHFKVLPETDARPLFLSLVETVSRARYSSAGPSNTSLLFGPCNRSCCRPVAFFAPEMLRGEGVYDLDQLEVWSLGVLLFKMLTGRQPFDGKTDEQTLKLIQNGKVRFPLTLQGLSLSGDARRLIRAMLCTDPEERITIHQVLQHPWLTTK